MERTEVIQIFRKQLDAVLDEESVFCCGGSMLMPRPRLVIEGVGVIPDELTEEIAKKIAAVATQAGYGLGAQTLVDTSVRNTLQIDPSNVSITNSSWHEELKNMVRHIATQMKIPPERVEAKAYKMLLYEKGGHFKPHTDTEKHTGMFGTLAVQFPCQFAGGRLVVRHRGKTNAFDFSISGRRSKKWPRVNDIGELGEEHKDLFHYLAHYADCEHEVEEVKSGYRLAMIYSLCWKDDCPPPVQAKRTVAEGMVDQLLAYDGCLGYILEHHYSQSALARYGSKALKGKDKSLCEFLTSVSDAIAEKVPDDKLSMCIVKATRFDEDWGEGDAKIGVPAIKNFEDDVFALDGSAPDARSVTTLKKFKMYDDIINKVEEMDNSGDYSDEENANDRWWLDSLGQQPHYIGNEGGANEKLYSCYMLAFWHQKSATSAAV